MTEPSALSPTLVANLSLLLIQNRVLADRVAWPCSSEHVAWSDDGRAVYRVHRTWLPLAVDDPSAGIDLGPGHQDVLVFGLGLGEQLEHLLSIVPKARILAWERDPWLLRQVLERRDWTAAMRRGQLKFLLTSDLLEVARSGRPRRLVTHPLLGDIYRMERALLDAPPERIALVAAGGLFVDDVAGALAAEGLGAFTWDLETWSREEIVRVAAELKPEVAVAINYTHGLAELCAEVGVPLRVWEIDPSTDVLPNLVGGPEGAASLGATIFTFRAANVPAFEAAGFCAVSHLPLAANPARRRPTELSAEQQGRYGADVTFVGSSMVEQGLRFRAQFLEGYAAWRGGDAEAAYAEADAAAGQVLDAQREDFSTYRVPELLEAALPEFMEAYRTDDAVYSVPTHMGDGGNNDSYMSVESGRAAAVRGLNNPAYQTRSRDGTGTNETR